MSSIQDAKDHLSAQLHGGSLNKVRNIEHLFERTQNRMLAKIDPIDTIRLAALTNTVHDDVYNYSLPSDYKKIIDLYPQDSRDTGDTAARRFAESFDVAKAVREKQLSIEASEGSKVIRINWRTRGGKLLHNLNSVTANGTWSAVGTASGITADTITKISGSGSIQFDSAASGDGIQNTGMSSVDMSDEDEVADAFLWFYIKNSTDLANLNSVTFIWGNDLTTNYWTGVAQTAQHDGAAFKVGWNQIKVPWSTATETGTVDATAIDSAKITFSTDAAITNLRVDNIVFSIGKNFDIKYYSKFIFKNSSGTLINRPTTDSDTITLDNDALEIWYLENLIEAAHQIEGKDSTFDINWAYTQLNGNPSSPDPVERVGLYAKYRQEYPSMSKRAVSQYGSHDTRQRWIYGGRG